MDIEAMKNMVDHQVDSSCGAAAVWTLGQLIDAVEKCEADSIRFDFGYMRPTGIGSYRGFYRMLALAYEEDGGGHTTKAELLKWLKDADGQTFTGYKGGDFTMDRKTWLWVANYGDSTSTAVVGFRDLGWAGIIDTRYVDM